MTQRYRLIKRTIVKGFTLIELIMSMVIVAVIAIPASVMLVEHIRSAQLSEDIVTACNLGRAEMERTLAMSYTNVMSQTFSPYEGFPYSVQRIVEYQIGSQGTTESLKKITIEVQKESTHATVARWVTLRAKGIDYGL